MTYRRMETQCITCKVPMVEERTPYGGSYDRCPTCASIWMEVAVFLDLLHREQPKLKVEELMEHNDGTPRRPCPRCGEKMSIAWLEILQLDQCLEHGVWFDQGELDRARKGRVKAKGLPRPPKEGVKVTQPGLLVLVIPDGDDD
jgi:Zn-finger nucleic acid-binding protein